MTDDPNRSSSTAFPGATSDGDAPSGASTIRHAATVVVMRPSAAGRQIYMVRRSAKSPFMPSTLVFPGGRLDPEDGPPDDDRSWEGAARRECQEEIGLGLTDLDLRWFDTWLTPSAESRRRYLARFFLVELQAGEGSEAEADGFETHEGRWATAAEHLAAWEAEQVDLPPPTVSVLLRLAAAEAEGLDGMLEVDPRAPILPKVIAVDNEVVIMLPHDPAYDDAPGEAAPAPSRVQTFPARFVRRGQRWCPS